MYVTNKLIYLQLQKTGCTHIASLLSHFLEGEQIGKHGPLTFDPCNRIVVGSIRNPWDWYVSLWSYGCQKKGIIYSELTSSRALALCSHARTMAKRPDLWSGYPKSFIQDLRKDLPWWNHIYSDSKNPELFRGWLTRILAERRVPYLEDGYPFLPIAETCGILTFRFLRLFTDYSEWRQKKNQLQSRSDVEEFYASASLTSTFVRMEMLEKDLSFVLSCIGCSVAPDDLYRGKTNASDRREIAFYYDEETAALVRDKDGFVCDLFGYEFSRE